MGNTKSKYIGKWKDAREVGKRKEISPVDIEEDRSRKRKDKKATGENEEEKTKFLAERIKSEYHPQDRVIQRAQGRKRKEMINKWI